MRGNCVAIDEAISGICYYFMRLPRRLRLLAMTIWCPHNNDRSQ
ncbi:RND transporter [Rickettsia hoogstraalii]|nr:RND transporter [Rickettsia hoogstraalii]